MRYELLPSFEHMMLYRAENALAEFKKLKCFYLLITALDKRQYSKGLVGL